MRSAVRQSRPAHRILLSPPAPRGEYRPGRHYLRGTGSASIRDHNIKYRDCVTGCRRSGTCVRSAHNPFYVKLAPSYLRNTGSASMARSRRRQLMCSLREGTTPPLVREPSTFRVLRGSGLPVRAALHPLCTSASASVPSDFRFKHL